MIKLPGMLGPFLPHPLRKRLYQSLREAPLTQW